MNRTHQINEDEHLFPIKLKANISKYTSKAGPEKTCQSLITNQEIKLDISHLIPYISSLSILPTPFQGEIPQVLFSYSLGFSQGQASNFRSALEIRMEIYSSSLPGGV